MDEHDDTPTKAEIERREKVRARLGISSVTDDQKHRQRNAVAAALASISGRRKSRSARPGRIIWGRSE